MSEKILKRYGDKILTQTKSPTSPSLKSQMVDPLIECNYMQSCATESWLFVGS